MANLYGYLAGNRGGVSRCGKDSIEATLETWEGRLRLTLGKDGTYALEISPKHGRFAPVYAGNVDEEVAGGALD